MCGREIWLLIVGESGDGAAVCGGGTDGVTERRSGGVERQFSLCFFVCGGVERLYGAAVRCLKIRKCV